MPQKVIFSERAYTAIVAETNEQINTETGGVFLGIVSNDVWYAIETIDPGPNSIFKPAYFEYDRKYINHLANKINKLYSDKLDVLGLWHRHPGSMDVFSGTDDVTNKQFAEGNKGVAISAIVNIDPKFRISMYLVTKNPREYKKIPCEVTRAIPRNIVEMTPSKDIEMLINSRSGQKHIPNNGVVRQQHMQSALYAQYPQGANNHQRTQQYPVDRLARYIQQQPYFDIKDFTFSNNEQEFDEIVGMLYDVINFCEKNGISVAIEKGNNNAVDLIVSAIKLSFFFFKFSNF